MQKLFLGLDQNASVQRRKVYVGELRKKPLRGRASREDFRLECNIQSWPKSDITNMQTDDVDREVK